MNKQIVIDRVEAASVILDFLTKDSACHAAEGDTQQGGRGALTEAGSHSHAAPLLPLFLPRGPRPTPEAAISPVTQPKTRGLHAPGVGPRSPPMLVPRPPPHSTHDGAGPSEFPRLTGGTVSQLVTVSQKEARSYQPSGKLAAF